MGYDFRMGSIMELLLTIWRSTDDILTRHSTSAWHQIEYSSDTMTIHSRRAAQSSSMHICKTQIRHDYGTRCIIWLLQSIWRSRVDFMASHLTLQEHKSITAMLPWRSIVAGPFKLRLRMYTKHKCTIFEEFEATMAASYTVCSSRVDG